MTRPEGPTGLAIHHQHLGTGPFEGLDDLLHARRVRPGALGLARDREQVNESV